jgi:hypothetical protein
VEVSGLDSRLCYGYVAYSYVHLAVEVSGLGLRLCCDSGGFLGLWTLTLGLGNTGGRGLRVKSLDNLMART